MMTFGQFRYGVPVSFGEVAAQVVAKAFQSLRSDPILQARPAIGPPVWDDVCPQVHRSGFRESGAGLGAVSRRDPVLVVRTETLHGAAEVVQQPSRVGVVFAFVPDGRKNRIAPELEGLHPMLAGQRALFDVAADGPVAKLDKRRPIHFTHGSNSKSMMKEAADDNPDRNVSQKPPEGDCDDCSRTHLAPRLVSYCDEKGAAPLLPSEAASTDRFVTVKIGPWTLRIVV